MNSALSLSCGEPTWGGREERRFIHSRRFSFFNSESKRASSALCFSARAGVNPDKGFPSCGGAACADSTAQSRKIAARGRGRSRRIETSGKISAGMNDYCGVRTLLHGARSRQEIINSCTIRSKRGRRDYASPALKGPLQTRPEE